MDSTCFPDWNTEAGLDQFPFPTQRKPLGLDSELVELLWQNGEVVLQSQTHRSQSHDYDPSSKHKQVTKTIENPSNVIQDEVTVSWIDESFEKEFCSNFLSEDKIQDFSPITLPPPRFEAFRKPCNNESYSVRTMGSSHCASNHVVNEEVNVGPRDDSMEERETFGQPMVTVSSSGGSDSSLGKTSSQSNETNTHKRKRDGGDSECKSDATELESAAVNKSSQKARRSRVAEVHNLSERRRRDRINEKLKALQELIPHSNKLDKASILDEAIEYVKSLQSQLQLMWMGSGMASMMVPGMQQYMSSRAGIGMGMLPAMQNLINLSSRLPSMNATQTPIAHRLMLNYQNQMRNPMFHANYMPFHSIPNNSQAINMFNFNSHSAQQNQALAPPGHGNGSIG